MKHRYLLWAVVVLCGNACSQQEVRTDWTTPFEQSEGVRSATITQATAYYKDLADVYSMVAYREWGLTDVGIPLSTVVVSRDGDFTPEKAREANKAVILVMNAIHAGESCGVDACMMLVRDLVLENQGNLLDKAVLVIIPIYNIGGSMNRSCCTRANQVGPEMQGFRGNALNLDLNRDFAKADSRNTRAFMELFQYWMPDLFVDTHTSNGADHQYIMTLITTQKDKLNPGLARYVTGTLEPELYRKMRVHGYEMTPYVHPMGATPQTGLKGYLETPRYSTGYAALFNTIGFVTEAHMLKTFRQRVQGTYHFLHVLLETVYHQRDRLIDAVEAARLKTAGQQVFEIAWSLDTTRFVKIPFKGYAAVENVSKVTGLPLITYDRAQPYQDTIRYYNTYRAGDSVTAPYAYVIPQAYRHLTRLLKLNGAEVYTFTKDTTLALQFYYIDQYESLGFPWEGHYYHTVVETRTEMVDYAVRKGDALVILNQEANGYIVAMLEPRAIDSWFRWNRFDPILIQKEYFSPYIFEQTATEMLRSDSVLAKEFQEYKHSMPPEERGNYMLLNYIYKRSPYYEDEHRRYPIGRCLEKMNLPVSLSP